MTGSTGQRAAPRQCSLIVLATLLAWPAAAMAQDVEPRRWTHLPVGLNVVAAGYVYTDGNIAFDPLLLIDDATVEVHTGLVSYVHAFDCWGKSGRVDLIVPYQEAHWEGLLDGVPASARRKGLADPGLRLSINLLGAPALQGQALGEFFASKPVRTVLGLGLSVTLPLGEYKEDKLLNLGSNRWTFRPQLGVLHTRGAWSFELSASAFFFTDNDEFWNGNEVEQDPLYATQTHVVWNFKPRWWVGIGAAYGFEGESNVNGVPSDNPQDRLLSGVAFGFPVGPRQGLKLSYIRSRTQVDLGGDTDSYSVGWSIGF